MVVLSSAVLAAIFFADGEFVLSLCFFVFLLVDLSGFLRENGFFLGCDRLVWLYVGGCMVVPCRPVVVFFCLCAWVSYWFGWLFFRASVCFHPLYLICSPVDTVIVTWLCESYACGMFLFAFCRLGLSVFGFLSASGLVFWNVCLG